MMGWVSGTPRSLLMVCLASAVLPRRKANSGDSGEKSMPMLRTRGQRKPVPMVMRQEAEEGMRSVSKLMMLAVRMPSVMKS